MSFTIPFESQGIKTRKDHFRSQGDTRLENLALQSLNRSRSVKRMKMQRIKDQSKTKKFLNSTEKSQFRSESKSLEKKFDHGKSSSQKHPAKSNIVLIEHSRESSKS